MSDAKPRGCMGSGDAATIGTCSIRNGQGEAMTVTGSGFCACGTGSAFWRSGFLSTRVLCGLSCFGGATILPAFAAPSSAS